MLRRRHAAGDSLRAAFFKDDAGILPLLSFFGHPALASACVAGEQLVRSSPTTLAPRFGESFASLDTPSAPSAPSLTLSRSTANGPLTFTTGSPLAASLSLFTRHSSNFILASLPFVVDWHRATDGFQWRGRPVRFALRSFAFSVVARSRLVKIGKSNQFRQGAVNQSLRSSLSRPSVLDLKPLSPLLAPVYSVARLQTKRLS